MFKKIVYSLIINLFIFKSYAMNIQDDDVNHGYISYHKIEEDNDSKELKTYTKTQVISDDNELRTYLALGKTSALLAGFSAGCFYLASAEENSFEILNKSFPIIFGMLGGCILGEIASSFIRLSFKKE